ncbi:DsrE/DsrF/DrsH-like family protein [Thiofaba sp. EF100]|uniref:DsrE/DsrF/DrsH-like family protein n=1 Tax=Thiofaba sp. EF100 TaxID=3121274 RepID=UPI0032219254
MSRKRLALLITRATPESAYAPLMMAATAAAMDYECKLFFAFGGLELLRPAPRLEVPGPMADAVPDLVELRATCLEQGVEMIACSASLSMGALTREQLMPEATVAGMATWLAFASGAEIQLNFG